MELVKHDQELTCIPLSFDIRPESRDLLRTEKGCFARVRSPLSSEMD